VGAIIGPLLAAVFAARFMHVRSVLWIAVVPAVICVLLLVIGVHEPALPAHAAGTRRPLAWHDARALPRSFWPVVGLGGIFALARFSEAFIVLRAQDAGLTLAAIPLVMVVMNVVYAAAAYPAGVLADRAMPDRLLLSGIIVLIASDLALATAAHAALLFTGAALWGLHLALTQGLFSKLVADAAPAPLRGTAFGVFNLVTGVALLVASIVAGAVWESVGPSLTFGIGAAFAAIAAIGLALRRERPSNRTNDSTGAGQM
jgi:MFS family permease